jgi:hypothetical protein
MDKKLLICGAGVLAGIAFFLSTGIKVAFSARAANSVPSKRERSVAERPSPSGKPVAVDAALLEKLRGFVKSDGEFDCGRFSLLLAKLVAVDPAAAADFAASIPAGPVREEALRRLSQLWSAKDPAAAEMWAAGLPDEAERQSTVTAICMQVAQSDAREAITIAERHGLDAGSGAVTENLVHQWAAQDFPAAAAWIKSRPAGERREQMVMRLAVVQSATEPAAAARLVVDEIPEGHVQTEAVISVIYQWARRDMAGAREWVGLFPESELRTRAETELSNIAAYQTPEQR